MEGNIKGKLACLNLEVAQFLMLNLNGKHVLILRNSMLLNLIGCFSFHHLFRILMKTSSITIKAYCLDFLEKIVYHRFKETCGSHKIENASKICP